MTDAVLVQLQSALWEEMYGVEAAAYLLAYAAPDGPLRICCQYAHI